MYLQWIWQWHFENRRQVAKHDCIYGRWSAFDTRNKSHTIATNEKIIVAVQMYLIACLFGYCLTANQHYDWLTDWLTSQFCSKII